MTNFYDKYMKYKTKYMELKSNAMEEGVMGAVAMEQLKVMVNFLGI